MRRILVCLAVLIGVHDMAVRTANAQANSYKQTNLVSDTAGLAPVKDTNLINPWGICIVPGDPFWISDNNSGVTTLYTKTGAVQGSFKVAPPTGSSNPATPTGCVGNSHGGFMAGGSTSVFIFDTEDGTISGWSGAASTVLAVVNSANPTAATGAVYKGLALLSTSAGNFLLATNFRAGDVEVYDTNFHLTHLAGLFTDANPPAVPQGSGSPGYAPFGIHTVVVNNTPMVIVTYALQDAAKHDPMNIAGSGFVDLFDENGNLVRRITADTHLNSPWGAVIPPATFGAFGGKLLVGNFGDGTINAFDFNAGTFNDQMKDSNGTVIANGSLWDLAFDSTGQTGDPNTMYITAGLASEMHGLFAAITANATQPAPTPDFTLSATPGSQTITAGQTAQFTITTGGLNGFTGSVALTCSGTPANATCGFAQSSLSPASGGMATTIMTVTTNASPYMPALVIPGNPGGTTLTMLIQMTAWALCCVLLFWRARRLTKIGRPTWRYAAAVLLLAALSVTAALAGGCGYSSNGMSTGTQRGSSTIMINATSGSLSHSTSVSLTVQ